MFEIGNSLRDARTRRGLDLSEIEHETHIRSRYLEALEEERFALLPGEAYAKGFLRTYADFLGLEGERFVDEYNSRFPGSEEPPAVKLARVKRRRSLFDSRLVAIPFAVLLALIGWQVARSGGGHHHVAHSASTPAPLTRAAPHVRVRTAAPSPAAARLVLAATRGPCWLSVRLGSETGRLVYEGMLEPGRTARFAGKRLWIRIGAPWNLLATLNGKPVALPTALGNVIATPTGLTQ